VITDLGPVLVGLRDADRPQQPLRKLALEPFPEGHREIFRRRDESFQPRNVGIQVSVVNVLDDLLVYDFLELLQVQDVAAGVVDLPGHHNVQCVIVAVLIDTFPERAPVLVL
jgi:hypothetical protein